MMPRHPNRPLELVVCQHEDEGDTPRYFYQYPTKLHRHYLPDLSLKLTTVPDEDVRIADDEGVNALRQ